MQQDKLVYKLKEFMALESFQVDLYKSQLSSLEDSHIKHVYERFTVREQEHTEYLKDRLDRYGEGVGVTVPAFKLAGMVTGKALDLLSLKDRYKLGIAVEHKAVQKYHEFIEMTRHDPELKDLNKYLSYFMVDEELHEFWFKEHLYRLENT
ncbi:MAG: ferritin-like domain-containing protein [Bacillota bacterium]